MKNLLAGLCAVLLGVWLTVDQAEAARLGGGRSVGTQRSITESPCSESNISGVVNSRSSSTFPESLIACNLM